MLPQTRAFPRVRTNPSMVCAMVSPASAMATTTRLSFIASALAFRIVGVDSGSRVVNAASHPPRNVRAVEFRISILVRYDPVATLMVSPESADASPCSTVLQGVVGLRQAFPTSLPCRETQRFAARLAAGTAASATARTSVPSAARMTHPPCPARYHEPSDHYKVEKMTSQRSPAPCSTRVK